MNNESNSAKMRILREKEIPLPPRQAAEGEEYKRILLIGPTGAGKTTFVRQLLGTSPDKEKFPSTGKSRTSVSNFEIILTDSNEFKAVVTFLGREYVVAHIEECLYEAVKVYSQRPDNKDGVFSAFMLHKRQEFRLKYIIGDILNVKEGDNSPRAIQILKRYVRYQNFIKEISALQEETQQNILRECELKEYNSQSDDEKEFFMSMVEETVCEHELFKSACDTIIEDIMEVCRDAMNDGKLTQTSTEWLETWCYTTTSRSDFIRKLNLFSGNAVEHFGSLVSPLVEGIRISGPFQPKWLNGEIPKLVIIDGKGIGHDVAVGQQEVSLSTSLIELFPEVDAIILTDIADRPLQGESRVALEAILTSGYINNVVLAFTKFDMMVADNLQNDRDSIQSIRSAFEQTVDAFKKRYGQGTADALHLILSDNRFVYLSELHTVIQSNSPYASGLKNLLKAIGVRNFRKIDTKQQPVIITKSPLVEKFSVKTTLAYDKSSLKKKLTGAIKQFHEQWDQFLNLGGSPSREKAQHWTRIKALTRHVGLLGSAEYDTLQPAADNMKFIQNSVYLFLQSDISWNGEISKDKMSKITTSVSQHCSALLIKMCGSHIIYQKRMDWASAFRDFSGTGSTLSRAKKIKSIYNTSTPCNEENKIIAAVEEKIIEMLSQYCQ